MTAFNTFFLLFKNDAAKSKKDVAELEKQIDSLRSKGKARSAEENQHLQDALKRQREMQKTARESERTYERLGNSIASAAAAYVSLGVIKSGIVNAAEFNRQLSTQAKNLGMNTQEIRAYGAAVKQAGGSQEWMTGYIAQQSKMYAAIGRKYDPKFAFGTIQSMVNAAQTNEAKRATLDFFGIEDESARLLFLEGRFMDAAYAAGEFSKSTEAGDKAARDFGQSTDKLGQSMTSFWSTVGTEVLPGMSQLNNEMAKFISTVASSGPDTMAFFDGIAAAATIIVARLAGATAALAALGGFAGWEIGKGISEVINPGSYGRRSWIKRGASTVAGWLDSDIAARNEAMRKAQQQTAPSGDTGGDAMSFWMSQGYSREQAAGIVANEMAESKGNPGARGDGGQAHGLYQWHPDRRRRILEATGIDVSTASAMDQRKAAAWEMKNEPIFNDETFRSITSPDQAAAYFSLKFERPADAAGEAFRRGQSALDIASRTPLSTMGEGGANISRTTSVKVDKVEVNTQATDAQGIAQDVGSELERILGFTFGNLDDGVAG